MKSFYLLSDLYKYGFYIPSGLGITVSQINYVSETILDFSKNFTKNQLGSKFNGQIIRTFGDFAALSFYPAHHIKWGKATQCLLIVKN